MSKSRILLICVACANPFRVMATARAAGNGTIACPYCAALNTCDLEGKLRAEKIPPSQQTYFWTLQRRQEASEEASAKRGKLPEGSS